jgi:serine protease
MQQIFFRWISLLLWGILILTNGTPLAAQSHHVPSTQAGTVLFQLQPKASLETLRQRSLDAPHFFNVKMSHSVAPSMGIWSWQTDSAQTRTLLRWLRSQPEVAVAQLNHRVEERSDFFNTKNTQITDNQPFIQTFFDYEVLPSDSLFHLQWQLNNPSLPANDLGADEAWDIATGGLTPEGDTIVVAVIDGGFAANHPDWGQNLWRNWADTPNDGIDNDNNGYTDDHRGWNVIDQNDNIAGDATAHGTSVAGIIGARGNNTTGVSGVNWRTQLMLVPATGDGYESDILEGYEYIRVARRRYNQSGGTQGAFVVAVNCSFGINYGQPDESPLWCAMLDSLGQVGIMTIGATANGSWNVDEVGDIPSLCPSPYLIAVNSLNSANSLPASVAWGPTSIDLGAYGHGVYTLLSGGTLYGVRNGTSFAAPQVSGGVGLLYSAPCANLTALSKANPALAVLRVRQLLLESVVPTPALSGKTATDGRLHLGQWLADYEYQCQSCPTPYQPVANQLDTTSAQLNWLTTNELQSVNLRFRAVGSSTWQEFPNAASPYLMTNLLPCTTYEFVVQSRCAGNQTSAWSPPTTFTTDGCCNAPSQIWATNVGTNSATVAWTSVTAAQGYQLQYRPLGGTWATESVASAHQFDFLNLPTCTQIEVRLKTICAAQSTDFSPSFFFQTSGCGSCLDSVYCESESLSAQYEWIQSLEIGDAWAHYCNCQLGYQNYELNLPDTLRLTPDTLLMATITPGFFTLSYQEMFRIYVDFDMDGDFDDPDDLAFDPGFSHDGAMTAPFRVPDFTQSGHSRMRVQMKFRNNQLNLPESCETFEYGQVRDYCVLLSTTTTSVSAAPQSPNAPLQFFPQPVGSHQAVQVLGPWRDHATVSLRVFDLRGQLIFEEKKSTQRGQFAIDCGTWPAGLYFVEATHEGQVFWGKMLR